MGRGGQDVQTGETYVYRDGKRVVTGGPRTRSAHPLRTRRGRGTAPAAARTSMRYREQNAAGLSVMVDGWQPLNAWGDPLPTHNEAREQAGDIRRRFPANAQAVALDINDSSMRPARGRMHDALLAAHRRYGCTVILDGKVLATGRAHTLALQCGNFTADGHLTLQAQVAFAIGNWPGRTVIDANREIVVHDERELAGVQQILLSYGIPAWITGRPAATTQAHFGDELAKRPQSPSPSERAEILTLNVARQGPPNEARLVRDENGLRTPPSQTNRQGTSGNDAVVDLRIADALGILPSEVDPHWCVAQLAPEELAAYIEQTGRIPLPQTSVGWPPELMRLSAARRFGTCTPVDDGVTELVFRDAADHEWKLMPAVADGGFFLQSEERMLINDGGVLSPAATAALLSATELAHAGERWGQGYVERQAESANGVEGFGAMQKLIVALDGERRRASHQQ